MFNIQWALLKFCVPIHQQFPSFGLAYSYVSHSHVEGHSKEN